MDHVQRFHAGDRVSTTRPLGVLSTGSCGTIQSVFISARGVYDVLFDTTNAPRIAFQPDLNLVTPAADRVGGVRQRQHN
jgi:hypothetical protein